MSIVTGESSSKLFLAQLLWFMQADDQVFRAHESAVHTMHRSGS